MSKTQKNVLFLKTKAWLKTGFLAVMLITTVQLQAQSQAHPVSLNLRNSTLKDFFKQIETQTPFTFVYRDIVLDNKKDVSIRVSNKPLSEVIATVLTPKGLEGSFKSSTIVVTKLPESKVASVDAQLVSVTAKKTVTGTVVDVNTGEPIIGASVVEKGTTNGVVTDVNGRFNLEVASPKSVLSITYIGYNQQNIEVGYTADLYIKLEEGDRVLDEVVVTALGIEKEKKALGYSVQQLDGELLTKVPSTHLMQSLTGKVAGLTVFNKLGTFEGPAFNIRGSKDILVIVDGVPGYDSWALNPENIETIDVIKGATGAALYGAQGTNGVIMITTKKGSGNKSGISIDVSSNSMFQTGYLVVPDFQTRYGQGMNGQYSYVDGKGAGVFDNEFKAWGPELNVPDPTTASGFVEIPQYNSPRDPVTGELVPLPWVTRSVNPIKEFLRPALITSNSIAVGGNNELGKFRLSANQTYKVGQAPNTDLFNNNFMLSGGYKFHDKIYVDASVGFNQLYSGNYETSDYDWQNYMLIIGHDFPANVSMDDLKDYWVKGLEGYKQRTWVENRNNPYWQLNERVQKYDRAKMVGWISTKIDFNKHLNLVGRVNMAYTTVNTEFKENLGNNMINSDGKGRFSKNMSNDYDLNSDFLLSYNNRFLEDALGLDASFGGSSRVLKKDGLNAGISAIIIPGLYNLDNRIGEMKADNNFSKKIVNSLYSSATLDYRRSFYLTVTARNDWSSALSLNYNSYFYPSFSFSTILSEYIKMPKFISFAKLRSSWARGRQDISPYWNSAVYNYGNTWSTNNTPMADYPNLLYTKDLKAQQLDTYEIGGDVRFFNNRLGIDVAYYYKSLTDMITTVPLSQASGFANRQINGREIITRGYEFAITAKPVLTKGFTWESQINLGFWKDYLGKLAPGETKYLGFYRETERIGTMRGKVWQRSSNGKIIYENGLPLKEDEMQRGGYLDPDLTFGFVNTFRYKNWNASIQFDGRLGGLIYNYQFSTMMLRGTAIESAVPGIREKPWIGYGDKVVSGEVIRDEYGNIVFDNREYAPNDVKVNYYDWVQAYYSGMHEVNMYDNTFLKLREINIGYNLTNNWLKENMKINNLYAAIIAQNLWLYSRVPYTDPDRGYSDVGQGPSPRMIGFNIKVNF